MGVAFFLDLDDGQAVDEQRGVEAAVLLAGDDSRPRNLVDDLINGVPGPDLFLVENGEKDVAAVVEVNFDLGDAV